MYNSVNMCAYAAAYALYERARQQPGEEKG